MNACLDPLLQKNRGMPEPLPPADNGHPKGWAPLLLTRRLDDRLLLELCKEPELQPLKKASKGLLSSLRWEEGEGFST